MPNRSQAKNSPEPNRLKVWNKIVEALGTDSPTKISRIVGITAPSISGWKKGGGIDKMHLLKIAKKAGKPLEWFLDDKAEPNDGDRPVQENEARIDLSDSDIAFIQKLAETEGKDFEAMVYSLVVEALRLRGGQLFADYHKIPANELEELLTYVLPRGRGGKRNGGSV